MKKWILSGFAVCILSLTSTALAELFDYRNTAMGGSGVASSNFVAAPLYNPALLTRYDSNQRGYVLTLPSVGVEYADSDELMVGLDDIVADIDSLEGELDRVLGMSGWEQYIAFQQMLASPLRESIVEQMKSLDKNYLLFDVALSTSLAKSNRHSGWAVSVNKTVDGGVGAVYDDADEQRLNSAQTLSDLDQLGSSVLGVAMYVTDYSFSYGREFWLADSRLAWGVTAKMQQVETLFYRASINNYNADDITNSENKVSDSGVNLDLGGSYWLNDHWNIGATVFNVIGADYETVHADDSYAKIDIAPLLVAALAYSNGSTTYALDIDLSDRAGLDIYAADKKLSLGNSRFYRVGAEWQTFTWLTTRLGYRMDRGSIKEDVLSVGVGLNYWQAVNFDLALMAGASGSYGGVLRLAMQI
ncbi:conjugal transfer protein TraF [Sinobacterium caligoides]|uniref:conjugal transfer protein TraF n=1 Tax=Sinobacterium caligoides TaxID=933926 RepID=UPI0013C2D6D2|nr:conjugal transfer protein TraF [Sinobacterium caligoides]